MRGHRLQVAVRLISHLRLLDSNMFMDMTGAACILALYLSASLASMAVLSSIGLAVFALQSARSLYVTRPGQSTESGQLPKSRHRGQFVSD